MSKVEINVPDGKVAEITKEFKDGENRVIITFSDTFKELKTFEDVERHLITLAVNKVEWAERLLNEYNKTLKNSYSEAVIKYRMVVAVLTNNEHLSMTKGNLYYPFVQFCKKGKKENCYGDTVVGEVNIDGTIYEIVGGSASYGSSAGLGSFDSYGGVSYSDTALGFRSVSSRKVAEHISKYFGKLVFEVMYGGCNTNWKWVD